MTEQTPDRPVVFWDCQDDAEVLTHTTKKGAIESYLDDRGLGEWEGKITVYGYAHMIASKPTMDDAVELVEYWFEMHWEELQGEDAPDTPNSTVVAAHQFLTVLHREFVPWACELVTSEEVDVAAWIAENRPDWLESK